MHTLALPKSVLCIELGPQWPLAHYELAHLIKKKPPRLASLPLLSTVCGLIVSVILGAAYGRVPDNLAACCGPERNKWWSTFFDAAGPDYHDGEYPGICGWGAAILATDPATLAAYPEAEMIHARWNMVSTLDCLTHELLAKHTSMQITAPVWFKAGAHNFPEGDLDYVGSSNLVHVVQIISTRDPAAAPWKEMIVAIVIEGAGAFNSSEGSSKHIEAGTKKVVITAPGKNYPAGTSRCLTPEWVAQYTGVQIDEPEWLEPGARIFSGGDLDYHDDSNLLHA